jgi:hypothetical protein
MKNLLVLSILLLYSVSVISQTKMTKGGVDASNTMDLQFNDDYVTTYIESVTSSPQFFTGEGYDPARKYHHKVLWNNSASQWEFTSRSGAIDSDGPTLRSTNSLAVPGNGQYYDNGNEYYYTLAYFPTCRGWTDGYQMQERCIDAVKLTITGSLASYDGKIVYVKTTQPTYFIDAIAYPVNGHPRYVGLSGSDSLQFVFKEGEWHFMTKPASSNAAWNARVTADWQTVATNSNATDLVPKTGWNIPGGGTMGVGGSASPLPVTLTKFNAKALPNKTVNLTWETTEEVNAAYFAVERSRDLKTFTEIARKESSLNSTDLKTYQVTDDSPAFGTNYYRLRQVDADGSFQVFRMVSAVISDQDQPFGAFPNPASARQFSLKVENANEAQVTLYDVLGIKHAASTQKESDNILIVKPQAKLSPGMYLAQVKNLTGTYMHKVYIAH